ncbi:MAG: hypothetical protein IIC22_01220 [Chloroflexi bacterium]|nr:hypothetical protein [Chloroflexota bacterium]
MDEIVLFDPKYEFTGMQSDLISVYNDIEKIEPKMDKLVREMNDFAKAGRKTNTLVIFDEFADVCTSS